MKVFVAVCIVLGLTAQLTQAIILAKYYPSFDYDAKICTGSPVYWSTVDLPGSGEALWTNGPRGKRDRYCIEYSGTLKNIAGGTQYLWADADDGVWVTINSNVVVDKWNSYDPRGCQNSDGCKIVNGNNAQIFIRYYQDYGKAHLVLSIASAVNGPWTALTANNFDVTGNSATAAANVGLTPLTSLTSAGTATCCYPNAALYATPCTGPTCTTTLPWVDLGRFGSVTELYRTTFWNGRGTPDTAYYYINQCTNMLYVGTNGTNAAALNGDNVVLQVTMGSYTDYFKPLPGQNLTICDMLMNNRFHLWSKTGEPGTFIQPVYYYHEQLVGGSDDWWPRYSIVGDNRQFLSFWGGNGAYGGCCHMTPGDQSKWNREASLKLRAMLPGIADPLLSNSLVSWTQPLQQWTKLAWVSGRWNTGVSNQANWVNLVNTGVRDSYAGVNGGVYFFRSCGTWNTTAKGGMTSTSNIIMAICMSEDPFQAPNCQSVVDFFKPLPGKNLCDMLTSNANHNWFYNVSGELVSGDRNSWRATTYVAPFGQHFGGSKDNWPSRFCQVQCNNIYTTADTCAKDPDNACVWNAQQNVCSNNQNVTLTNRCTRQESRTYLPFWGGNQGGLGRQNLTGSRTQWDSPGQDAWTRDYYLYIAKME